MAFKHVVNIVVVPTILLLGGSTHHPAARGPAVDEGGHQGQESVVGQGEEQAEQEQEQVVGRHWAGNNTWI